MRARVLTALLIVLGVPASAPAHDPGFSALEVRVARTHLSIELSLAARDAEDAARDEAFTGIDAFARRGILLSVDGRTLQPAVADVSHDDAGGVRVTLTCARPPGDRLIVRSIVPQLLARGHRQLLSIRTEDGALVAEQMLDAEAGEVAVDLRAIGGGAGAAAAFFHLGLAHILFGYDHLLFLAGLLVVARRTGDAVRTVTAFTIAHSLTLVLTVIGWVELPAAVVEPLIAASIMYVGAENILRAQVPGRWRLAFAFGLVHGFGFAGALRELGVGENGAALAVPLASFNLGVEAGQVAVALVVVPIVSRLRAYPAVRTRLAAVGSIVILLAGAYWLAERAFMVR